MKKLTKKQKAYFDNFGVNPIEEGKIKIQIYKNKIQAEKNALAYFINLLKLPLYKFIQISDWDLKSINIEIADIRNRLKDYRKDVAYYTNNSLYKESA